MTLAKNKNRPVRVGLMALGCAKNLVDAEIMLGSLLKDGVEITNDASQADVVIVNTCAFTDSAQEESVDAILESAAVREARNRGQGLVVAGCLPQRFRDELPKLFPEVDAFMGIDQVANVGQIVKQAIARRLEISKTGPPPKVQSPKSKIAARLGALEQQRPESKRDPSASFRGSAKAGKARTRVAPFTPQATRDTPFAQKGRAGGESNVLLEVNRRPNYIPDYATPRFRLTPRHFAYVKIAEGCNHPCSFCIIPRMRGSHRSRMQGDIISEAKGLIADGAKELNLISQDSTYYGLDLRLGHSRAIASPERFSSALKSLPAEAATICTLLRELNALRGEFWIRLLYTHPAHWTDELIQTLADCPKVARYVDIPLQHIHENMLQRMRRETSRQYIVDLLRKIRTGVPGITLRTTFIVGFPGETEACFQELLDFIRETKFERLGVFTYSQEEGTLAGRMVAQIPDKIRKRRRDLAMAAQQEVAAQVSESFVGRTIRVLVESEARAEPLRQANLSSWEHGFIRQPEAQGFLLGKGRYLVARGEADAPDIDGRVYVRAPHRAMPVGEFARVKIIGHAGYDLMAEPV